MTPEQWQALQIRARHDVGDHLVPQTTRAKMIEFIVLARSLGKSGRSDELMRRQYRTWRTPILRQRYRQIVIAVVPMAIVAAVRGPYFERTKKR